MKLKWDKNREIEVNLLNIDDLSVSYQQELLELAEYVANNQNIKDGLPIGLKSWVLSIFLHLSPLENNIQESLDYVFAEDGEVGSQSVVNPEFEALVKFLNAQNKRTRFNEFDTIGFIKAKIRSSLTLLNSDDIKKFIAGLKVTENERSQLSDWFYLNVLPSFYVSISIKDWERISYLNNLNEFIELTIERCKTTVGEGVFYEYLKRVELIDILEFNENQLIDLHEDEYKLISNVYHTIIKTHQEDNLVESFEKKWYDIITQHKHNQTSLEFTSELFKDVNNTELKELINLGSLLKVYDLKKIGHLKDSTDLQRDTLTNSLSGRTSIPRDLLQNFLSIYPTYFAKIPTDEFHELIINSLLTNNQFNLIKYLPNIKNHETLLINRFWYYYRHDFNNCYKILDYLPKQYTIFLSSMSSFPGISPSEFSNSSSSRQMLERFYQLNPKEYENFEKHNNVLNVLAELLPHLKTDLNESREIAIEYGLIQDDFHFIIDECFKLLSPIDSKSDKTKPDGQIVDNVNKDLWLLIYKVTKIISINYANDEIQDVEIVHQNLKLLLKLVKFVPVSNISDVIQSYKNLKSLILENE